MNKSSLNEKEEKNLRKNLRIPKIPKIKGTSLKDAEICVYLIEEDE